jgi:transcription termination factor NusB
MFRLDKRKIFLLYQYYLLDKSFNKNKSIDNLDEKEQKRIFWFNGFLKDEAYLREKIAKKLKIGWEFSRLPPLEKAILTYAAYELLLAQDLNQVKMIIDQTINFSKAYLEEGKYKYINKVLDLLFKEKSIGEFKKA